ncbi:MAG TPA: rhodanese-like domain-containing protein [Polyangiaceae bacterium]
MPESRSPNSVALALAWRVLVLLSGGAAVGMGLNHLRHDSVSLRPYVSAAVCSAASVPQDIRVLMPAQAAKLCGDSRTLVADVRDGAAFAAGHVAGAVHIQCSGSHADVEHVRSGLVGKEALVVYGETEDQARQVASDLAQRINRADLSVAVIAGGWKAWFDAGMACASGPCEDCEGLVSHDSK